MSLQLGKLLLGSQKCGYAQLIPETIVQRFFLYDRHRNLHRKFSLFFLMFVLVSKCCLCIITSTSPHLILTIRALTCRPKMSQRYRWDVIGENSCCHWQCLKPAERVTGSLLQHFRLRVISLLGEARQLCATSLENDKKSAACIHRYLILFKGSVLWHLKLKSHKTNNE